MVRATKFPSAFPFRFSSPLMTDVAGKTWQRRSRNRRLELMGCQITAAETALSKINASRPRSGNAESSCPSVLREPVGRCRASLASRRQRRAPDPPGAKQRLILVAERLSVCLRLFVSSLCFHLSEHLSVCLHFTVCVSVSLFALVYVYLFASFRLSVCLHSGLLPRPPQAGSSHDD